MIGLAVLIPRNMPLRRRRAGILKRFSLPDSAAAAVAVAIAAVSAIVVAAAAVVAADTFAVAVAE